jgi:hypothetical protein
MSWDASGRYYYRSMWEGGKPRRVYVGSGRLGKLAAAQDAQSKAQRAADDAQRRAQRAADRDMQRAADVRYRALRAAVWAQLQAAGYYQHKREWRRMDLKAFAKRYREAEERDAQRAAGALVQSGKGAKVTASTDTDYHPATGARGDLPAGRALSGLMVAEQMVSSYCKGQPEAQAVIGTELRTLCRDLGWDSAPPFERELIAHVAECWVWLKLVQLTLNWISSAAHTIRDGDYRERRVTEAQRRYLRAMNLLAKLRHLGPAVQVNVANQQVVMNGKGE